jgi:hypothetical protein
MHKLIMVVTILMISLSSTSFGAGFSSSAAARPDVHAYDNSTAAPCIGFGPECEDNRPDVIKPRKHNFDIPVYSEYDAEVKKFAENITDWYLNQGGMDVNSAYTSSSSPNIKAAKHDILAHKDYYSKCISYGTFRAQDTLRDYFQTYTGTRRARMINYFMDGVLQSCYNNR